MLPGLQGISAYRPNVCGNSSSGHLATMCKGRTSPQSRIVSPPLAIQIKRRYGIHREKREQGNLNARKKGVRAARTRRRTHAVYRISFVDRSAQVSDDVGGRSRRVPSDWHIVARNLAARSITLS